MDLKPWPCVCETRHRLVSADLGEAQNGQGKRKHLLVKAGPKLGPGLIINSLSFFFLVEGEKIKAAIIL